ncbi:TadE/TadG family type IV pilus assembly protein [Marivita geojedonensis]|uniref:TadE/TadG family type IV pilus assembly protein n=1 Tax=Marivita geojedonensis TaxID=1123756 RepID=UPI000A1DA66D
MAWNLHGENLLLRLQKTKSFPDEEGAILVEALIIIPVITIFTIGILEFGNILWQRHQLETGVRDAARYWSRCRPTFGSCSTDIARNIAFYGTPVGGGRQRVPGWTSGLSIQPTSPPPTPTSTDLVTVTGTHTYQGSPLFSALRIPLIDISYSFQTRYVGW